jgi:hypothetical protein
LASGIIISQLTEEFNMCPQRKDTGGFSITEGAPGLERKTGLVLNVVCRERFDFSKLIISCMSSVLFNPSEQIWN